jgi:hypothetical protein
MSSNLTPIDISSIPELVRLAEEVAITRKPRELIRERKTLAILIPPTATARSKKKLGSTHADVEAFRSAAGSWRDVDVEQFKKNVSDSRKMSTRLTIKL